MHSVDLPIHELAVTLRADSRNDTGYVLRLSTVLLIDKSVVTEERGGHVSVYQARGYAIYTAVDVHELH